MKTLLQFATIRFMPFAETQEFANVGILAFTPDGQFVDYQLAPNSFKRVNQFFDDLEGKLYKCALTSFEGELKRVKDFCRTMQGQELINFMTEVTRPREGILIFGQLSAILTENPRETLADLFDKYIGRNFQHQKEYREAQMVRALKSNLIKKLPKAIRYKEDKLDVGYAAYTLPLVAKAGNTVKAIKPLAFDQKTTLQLTEHGDRWIARAKHLLNANVIRNENLLFAIEKPKKKKNEFLEAFDVVYKGMQELDVQIVPYNQQKEIVTFAQFEELNNPDNYRLIH